MGTSKQQTTQESKTAPWEPAQPLLQGILGQLQTALPNTGLTGAENTAITGATNNAYDWTKQYAPQIGSYATSLLNGGGATDQAGNVNQNYLDYKANTQGLASNTNYDPRSTPGMSDLISTLTGDITQGVNGQFAAAGRDFSGANSQALGRGLTQGLAPVLLDQYNRNRDAQQGAAGNLYSAGNTNAGILSGLQQQKLANQGQGVNAAGAAMDANNAGYNATMQAEAQKRNAPLQNLSLLASLGIPIAGLGGQSTGTSNTTKTASPLEQAMQVGGIFKSFFPAGL